MPNRLPGYCFNQPHVQWILRNGSKDGCQIENHRVAKINVRRVFRYEWVISYLEREGIFPTIRLGEINCGKLSVVQSWIGNDNEKVLFSTVGR